jgi:DNA-binding beta-propeller fold protein YncE
VLSGLLRRLSVVGCVGVLVVLLIAMFVPGAYASQRAGVTRAVPSDARGRFGSFGSALVGSAPVGNGPSFLAINPATHTIYVANGYNDNGSLAGGDTVSIIDERDCNASDVFRCQGPWPTITVGNKTPSDLPAGIAVDEATDTIYVANVGNNTVSVFNGAACNAADTSGCGQTPAEVPVGLQPLTLFADPANHTVYVTNYGAPALGGSPGNSTTVSMINSATCDATDLASCPDKPPPTVKVGAAPDDVTVDQATHTVYVTTIGIHNGWAVFDASTCNATVRTGCATIGRLIGDPSGPNAAEVDLANDTLYTANYDNTISAFSLRHCYAADLAGCATQTPGSVTIAPPEFFENALFLVVDAPLHTVYAVNQKDDTVSVIDTNICNGKHLTACATLQPPTVHTGEDPETIALNPQTQTLYTANQVTNDVSVIDASRCNATDTRGCRQAPPAITLTHPGALAADPAVSTVYVATGMNTVSMIDSQRCNAFRHDGCTLTPPTVNVGASGIALDPKTHTVYVANFGSSVSVFNAETCNASTTSGCDSVQTLQLPGGLAGSVAVDAATNTVYVTTAPASGPNTVSVFNGATCDATDSSGCTQVPHSVTVGFGAAALAVDTLTDTVYVANEAGLAGNTVSVIDGATCNAANTTGCANAPQTITVGPAFTSPDGVAIDEATDTIYIADLENGEGSGTVSVINGATCNAATSAGCGQTPQNVTVGFGPDAIAFDYLTRSVVVANQEDTSVSVIDAATCNAIISFGCGSAQPKLPVGRVPSFVAIDPTVGTIYTSNGDNTVSIVPAIR